MPIYEYECQQCGERFSALLAVSQRDEAEKTLVCPACNATQARRLMSTFASRVSGAAPGARPASNCDGGG